MEGTVARKTVLLLKSGNADDQKADEYHECITQDCDVNCFSIPALQFNFCNTDKLTSALENIETYAGVILTSQRAIEAVSNAVVSPKVDLQSIKTALERIKLFVVGKTTAKAVEEFGKRIGSKFRTEGMDAGSAENLAKYIIDQKLYNHNTKPLLFICGQLARPQILDLLNSSDITTTMLCAYETIPNVNFKVELKEFLTLNGDPNLISFFSPSGAEFTLPTIVENVRNFNDMKIVAIGQTTASWLQQEGYQVRGVAQKPTENSLSECIRTVLNKLRSSAE